MTNELATGCDRCLTLQSGANTAKHCNQGLPCVGLFKRRCADSDILSSSRTSYSDQCLRPSPEEKGLGVAKVRLVTGLVGRGEDIFRVRASAWRGCQQTFAVIVKKFSPAPRVFMTGQSQTSRWLAGSPAYAASMRKKPPCPCP